MDFIQVEICNGPLVEQEFRIPLHMVISLRTLKNH